MAKCLYCNKEYTPKRATSKYCSDRCRKLAFLKVSVPELSVPLSVPDTLKNAKKVSVPNNSKLSVSTDKKISVSSLSVSRQPEQPEQDPTKLTNEQRIGKVFKGYCHGCGKKITTIEGLTTDGSYLSEEQANNICICLKCIRKGITHESLGLAMCEVDL